MIDFSTKLTELKKLQLEFIEIFYKDLINSLSKFQIKDYNYDNNTIKFNFKEYIDIIDNNPLLSKYLINSRNTLNKYPYNESFSLSTILFEEFYLIHINLCKLEDDYFFVKISLIEEEEDDIETYLYDDIKTIYDNLNIKSSFGVLLDQKSELKLFLKKINNLIK